MKCRYCERLLKNEGMVCPACGYDPKTDTISDSFKPNKNLPDAESKGDLGSSSRRVMGPRMKKIAFFGLGLIALSIFYKYNFNFNAAASDLGAFFNKFKDNNFNIVKTLDDAKGKSAEEAKKDILNNNFVVQGIFFDHYGKSLVIANGRNFSEGDVFKGIIISRINNDSVEIVTNGQNQVLRLNQSVPFPEK